MILDTLNIVPVTSGDTWTCHLHRESRLTPHTDITPQYHSRPWSKSPTHSPPTSPTPPKTKHRHTSNTPPVPTGLVSPNPILSSTHPPLHPHRPVPNTCTCHTFYQHLSLHSSLARHLY